MEPYAGGPGSTWSSLAVDLTVLVLILASCSVVVAEWLRPALALNLAPLELFFTSAFVVEYLLRWFAAEDRRRYPFTALAVLDLLAILPGLLALSPDFLLLRVVRGVRLLRLLRLVRLLRLLRYGPLIHRGLVLGRVWAASLALRYRLSALGRLFLWALVTLVVGANLLHLTESAMGGGAGPFGSYWRSYWNILIVLVSGIEDKEPASLAGRVEITLVLVAGLVIVGMLTAEIVAIIIRRAQRAGRVALKPPTGRFEGHVLILGVNHHLDSVVRQVHAAMGGRHHILVVDPAADQLETTDTRVYRRLYALPGEPRDTRVLEQADVDTAARVIVLSPTAETRGDRGRADDLALMTMLAVLCRNRSIPITVHLQDEASLRYSHGVPEVDFVVTPTVAAPLLAQAVANPGVTSVFDHLLAFTDHSNEIYSVPVPPRLVGTTFADAQLYFLARDDEPVTLLGVDRSPPDAPSSDLLFPSRCPEPLDRLRLTGDDRLLVLAYQQPSWSTAEEDRWQPTWLARGRS